jgi:hypothetical protein
MSDNGGWIDAGTDALEAQRKRKRRLTLDEYNRLSAATPAKNTGAPLVAGRITLAAAAEKYFVNCEARGLDPETIRNRPPFTQTRQNAESRYVRAAGQCASHHPRARPTPQCSARTSLKDLDRLKDGAAIKVPLAELVESKGRFARL